MPRGIRKVTLLNPPSNRSYIRYIANGKNPGYLYFLVAEDIGLVKIGASNRWSNNFAAVDKRIAEIKRSLPMMKFSQERVIVAMGLNKNESEVHDHFKDYRVGGEWFLYCDSVKELVESLARLSVEHDNWHNALPTEMPWKLLEVPAVRPTKRFVGLHAEIEDV